LNPPLTCRSGNFHWQAFPTFLKIARLPNNGRYTKLKHIYGRRLSAVGALLETRKVLLHHTNGDITTHYSGAEVEELIEAAERVVGENPRNDFD